MSSSSPSSRHPTRAARRRVLQRVVIGLLVVANLAVAAVYIGLQRVDDIVGTAIREEAEQLSDVVDELTPPPASSSEPLTFLVIGSDSREGLDDLEDFGDFAGARADVVMLVKMIPTQGRAQVLSLPRDLWVPIDGHGENRINAAYAFGGSPLLVDTVKSLTGVPIHHYVEIDFAGFQAIVDQVGGITLDFAHPARDVKSGFEVDAGTRRLDGAQALAYARSRSYQELVDGTWTTDGSGDFGRTARQQEVLVAVLEAAARPSSLLEMGELVGSFARHMAVDATFADRSIVELGFAMRGLRGADIDRATLPGTPANRGGRSVVIASEPGASDMLAAFAGGSPLSESSPPSALDHGS